MVCPMIRSLLLVTLGLLVGGCTLKPRQSRIDVTVPLEPGQHHVNGFIYNGDTLDDSTCVLISYGIYDATTGVFTHTGVIDINCPAPSESES